MARSYRYDADDYAPAHYSHSPECDDCGQPTAGSGSLVQDSDGFSVFVCRPCAKDINAHLNLTLELVR